MSSKEDPFGSDGKTVIRPRSEPAHRAEPVRNGDPAAAAGRPPQAKPANATMIFDGPLQAQPGGQPSDWQSGTVFFQDTPPADDGWGGGAAPGTPLPNRVPNRGGKLPLESVLSASENIQYAAANPFLSAAAQLLLLFGRLRQMTLAAEPGPLAAHIADAIREFERKLSETAILPADIRIAKYALCETADDIVQNLPGADKQGWKPYSMLSQFFQTTLQGVGFYEALNKVLSNPEAHHDLLELMHACLSLGFEGQYRGTPARQENFDRVRRDVYESLRYFREKPSAEISPHWQGLSAAMANARPRIPLWAIAAGVIALVTGAFFIMRVAITNDGDALADQLLALSPATPVVIERAAFVPVKEEPPKPVTSQLERIRGALDSDIKGGNLSVDTKGEFIVVGINNVLLFASGRAETKPEFEPIAGRIAAALDKERGQIRVVGHTDNVKPKKSGAFKSNYDLSIARAKAVEAVIAPKIADGKRIAVEGKGEDEPIADNSTPEGRTKNRRVDLMIPREESL